MTEQTRLLRLKEVMQITGISRAGIYQKIANGDFPRQVKLGTRSAAWLNSEVAEWVNARITERDEDIRELIERR